MAVLVLSATGKIEKYRAYIFSNVGDDSEHPDTLDYFHNIAIPYATQNGLDLEIIHKHKRDGSVETLYNRAIGTRRSIPIPARMSNGAPGRRTCTADFKVRNIAAHIRDKYQDRDFTTGIGFSIDEIHRAKTVSKEEVIYKVYETQEYPLIDLRLSRQDCQNIINAAGLPIPPKSACYFCPFHSPAEWIRLKQSRPDLFNRAVTLEKRINEKRINDLNKDAVYFHPKLIPLDLAVSNQLLLPFDETEICNTGYCFT